MASLSALNIARSASTGRVFARYQFDQGQLDSLVADLSYATTPEAISSATRLRQIATSVLRYIREQTPESGMGTLKGGVADGIPLKQGWNVRLYDGMFLGGGTVKGTNMVGFMLSHKYENINRVRTILSSLEEGSRAYTVFPVEAKMLAFQFPYPDLSEFAFAKKVKIPRRKGFFFIKKTLAFADHLLAAEGTNMEAALADIVNKGRRFRASPLDDSFNASDNKNAIAAARKDFGKMFAQAKNPLNYVNRKRRR